MIYFCAAIVAVVLVSLFSKPLALGLLVVVSGVGLFSLINHIHNNTPLDPSDLELSGEATWVNAEFDYIPNYVVSKTGPVVFAEMLEELRGKMAADGIELGSYRFAVVTKEPLINESDITYLLYGYPRPPAG